MIRVACEPLFQRHPCDLRNRKTLTQTIFIPTHNKIKPLTEDHQRFQWKFLDASSLFTRLDIAFYENRSVRTIMYIIYRYTIFTIAIYIIPPFRYSGGAVLTQASGSNPLPAQFRPPWDRRRRAPLPASSDPRDLKDSRGPVSMNLSA